MVKALTYKFSRLVWSIYFVLTIAVVGVIFGYFLTFFIFFFAMVLSPWDRASDGIRRFGEDFQCLSIRMLLRMQPWLKCETNLYPILGFYRHYRTRRILFVANHRSNLDTFLLISYIPGLRGLAKSSLFYNIFFSPFMVVAGFVPVSKGNQKSLLQGLKILGQEILQKNRAVLVFPETTRCPKGFPSMQKFSASFFSVAVENEALVVPLVIRSTDRILGRGDFLLHPFQATSIEMLEPIEATAFGNFVELRDLVWQRMSSRLNVWFEEGASLRKQTP
ncbi:MAG: 1-acyl-sn-glycerol-3-phosphate acyltransferase [Bdellovibrionaceae bacterium]|nr:1-acyl-sn-glycerol-3-phosphate acyltransferase [Pseudobdellovibrionaceae bacterium]